MKRTTLLALLITLLCTMYAQTATLPYAQDFSSTTFPPQNPDWTVRDRGGQYTWLREDYGTASSYSFAYYNSVTPDDWLISPSFLFEQGHIYKIEFDIRELPHYNVVADFLSVYTMTGSTAGQCIDNNPNNILLWSGLSPQDWMRVTAVFMPSESTAGVRFIGFRHHNCTGQRAVEIDNISFFEAVPYDLGFVTFTGQTTYANGVDPYILNTRNFGSMNAAAGSYSIQFQYNLVGEAPAPLGSPITDTPALPAGETVPISIDAVSLWAFDVPVKTTYQVSAVLTYAADTILGNNTSNALTIAVYPINAGVANLMGGETELTDYYPVCWSYRYSISQTVFTAEEMGGISNYGKVLQLTMRMFDYNVPSTPFQIFLANAPADFTSYHYLDDIVSYENFTKVYEGPTFSDGHLNGVRDFTLIFGTGNGTEDFIYTGGALVMMMFKVDGQYFDYRNEWHITPTPDIRGVYLRSDSQITDPASFTQVSLAYANDGYPKSMFIFERSPQATLSGTVTSTSGAPLAGATVSLTESPTTFATTGENGEYTIAGIPLVMNTGITVTVYTYETQSIPASDINWDMDTLTATVDVQMVPLPAGLTISGYVKRGDNGEGTNGITVSLTGYTPDAQTTTSTHNASNGYFIFENLYGGHTYSITIDYPRFQTHTQDVTLVSSSVILPEIVLSEILSPPLLVTLKVDDADDSQSIVSWINPYWGFSNFSYALPVAHYGVFSYYQTIEPHTLTMVHRYAPEQIAGFNATGYNIHKIGFIPTYVQGQFIGEDDLYIVKLWITSDLNLAYPLYGQLFPVFQQTINSVSITYNEINEVVLPNEIPIPPNSQIFVGYEMISRGASAGLDPSNEVYGYSDLLRNVDGRWYNLRDTTIGAGSWCIYVTAMEPENPNAPYPPATVVFSATGIASDVTMGADSIYSDATNMVSDTINGVPTIVEIPSPKTSTDYFLGHMPNRTGTRTLNGDFEIYRMPITSNIPNTPLHTTTSAEINMAYRNMQYIDTEWETLTPNIAYRYAVKAKYHGSQYPGEYSASYPVYSNNLLRSSLVPVTINVERQGYHANGAVITVTSDNPDAPNHIYTLLSADNSSHTFTLYKDIPYNVKVAYTGSPVYNEVHIFTEMQNTLNVNLLYMQQIFNEPLDGTALPNGWVNVDADGDGFAWRPGAQYNYVFGPTGGYVVYSQTWDRNVGDLIPDNWLITSPIWLPGNSDIINLEFMIGSDYGNERLLIYIAPSDNTYPSWQTFLVNRSPVNGSAGSPDFEVLQNGVEMIDDHTFNPDNITTVVNSFYTLNYDISQFAGETVRIAFRHAFCEDNQYLKLANMAITVGNTYPLTVSGTVIDNHGVAVSGATVALSNPVPPPATTNADGSFTVTNVPSYATYNVLVSKQGYVTNTSTVIEVTGGDYVLHAPIVLTATNSDSDLTKPAVTALHSNYPNPFNPSTVISFDVAARGAVCLDIYNIKGQKVRELVDEVLESGSHTVEWNGFDDTGRAVSSGIYFYRMRAGEYVGVRKMLLMK